MKVGPSCWNKDLIVFEQLSIAANHNLRYTQKYLHNAAGKVLKVRILLLL